MKSSIINISTLFFALSPLLGIYYIFPGTTIAFFLLLIMLPLNIVFLRTKLDKPLFTWFLSVIIIGWISALINIYTPWFNVSLFFNNHWSIFLCFFPLIFILPHLNVKLYVKLILIIGLFSALFSLYQRLQIFVLGEIIHFGHLPGFTMLREFDTLSFIRPSSFFLEPAHLCIYLLPVFYISLYLKRYTLSTILFLSLIFSESTTGLILSVLIFLIWLFQSKVKKLYKISVLAILLFLVVYIVSKNNEYLEFSINKISSSSSSDSRLLGALEYLLLFNDINILFGIGLNQLNNYLLYHNIYILGSANYANASIYMFISYGLLGFFFYVIYLYRLYRRYKYSRVLLFIFICILCSDQLLFNVNLLYLITTIVIFNLFIKEYTNKNI